MGALRDAESKLAAAVDTRSGETSGVQAASGRDAALQQVAVVRSWTGDERGALDAFNEAVGVDFEDAARREDGEAAARRLLDDYEPVNAIAAIAAAASDRQIVILNEAHHAARDRAFGLALARELRKSGFEYLAMETLAPDTAALMKRGYPVGSSGTYTREPFFGDFVRQAISMGYILVAYEQDKAAPPNADDMFASIEAREESQAQNLVDRVLREHPHARLLIYAGYQHVMKGEIDTGGRMVAWMAERLRRKTGIEPLCIDQANASQQSPYLVRGLENLAGDPLAPTEVALRDKTGGYWPRSRNVDMQVIHVSDVEFFGRSLWITWSGERHKRQVPPRLLPRHGSRLIQAFIAGESADAVPVDQVLATAGIPPPFLLLPDRDIRFAVQD